MTLPRGRGVPPLGQEGTSLVNLHEPVDLQSALKLHSPVQGLGEQGLLSAVQTIMDHSVNTWSAGFLDKLYASPDPPGVAAELVLAVLNTNAHVFTVSPALSCIEKHVTRALAELFGLNGSRAGGASMPGGAAANTTSMLVARNVMFPSTKAHGVATQVGPLAVFTSSESHYSVSAAAATLGLGSSAVHAVSVDAQGAMSPSALATAIEEAIAAGKCPFYVCATAGTTVRGAYDPLPDIANVCERYHLWLHVDACWGGPAIFSNRHRHKLAGSARAQTLAINPHKMLGVPVTCSFLLSSDLRAFSSAHKLDNAGYLFHGATDSDDASAATSAVSAGNYGVANLAAPGVLDAEPNPATVFDLASLTPQCGRRADSLKFYLAWLFHGSDGFAAMVDRAFAAAALLAQRLQERSDVEVISSSGDPPCGQVCFWYVGHDLSPKIAGGSVASARRSLKDANFAPNERRVVESQVTRELAKRLVRKGWMVDFAPGGAEEDGEVRGEYLRVVMNRMCSEGIVEGLLKAIGEVGTEVVIEKLNELHDKDQSLKA